MELHQTWHSVKLYGFDVVRYDSFYKTTNWLRRTCSSNKEYFWHSFFFFFFLQTFVFNWWFKIFLWLVICSRKGKSPDRQIPFNFIFWVWGEKRKLFLYKPYKTFYNIWCTNIDPGRCCLLRLLCGFPLWIAKELTLK